MNIVSLTISLLITAMAQAAMNAMFVIRRYILRLILMRAIYTSLERAKYQR